MYILKVRINIMLSPRIIKILDNVASRHFLSRSQLISNIIFDFLKNNNLFCCDDDGEDQDPRELEVI